MSSTIVKLVLISIIHTKTMTLNFIVYLSRIGIIATLKYTFLISEILFTYDIKLNNFLGQLTSWDFFFVPDYSGNLVVGCMKTRVLSSRILGKKLELNCIIIRINPYKLYNYNPAI